MGKNTRPLSWSKIFTTLALLGLLVSPAGSSAVIAAGAGSAQLQSTCPCSIWGGTPAPTGSFQNSNPIELGVKFRSDVAGYILGVSFYKPAAATGTHLGHLWSSSGTKLAEATFTNETASGWQSVTFNPAVPIQANTTYIASYLSNDYFALDLNFFATSGVDNTPLHALAAGVDGPNGVYRDQGGFPNQTYSSSNYWVDVSFSTTAPPDTTPPTVVAVSPANGSSLVSTKTSITARFSENVQQSTLNANSFLVLDSSKNQVAGSIAYDSTTFTATFTPSAALHNSTPYSVTVKGGANGVQDLAGNPLASDYTWAFTTSTTLWAGAATPASSYRNPNPVELGLKFRSDVSGFVIGVSFYKVSGATGTHLGHLWTMAGTQLAEAVFTNETASGWQTVRFTTPVPIVANTTYIVSYLSNDYFALDQNYFASAGVDNPPLHALANGIDGPNGVYRDQGGYPVESNLATNYWVDVLFDTTAPPDPTPPSVLAVTPPSGMTRTSAGTRVQVRFSKPMQTSTINSTTFSLVDPSGKAVAGSLAYDPVNFAFTFTPGSTLSSASTYTATVNGGSSGVLDLTGNPLSANMTWSFTTAAPAAPFSPQGPGGPILIVTSTGNPFTQYYSEILRNEGFNEFLMADIGTVTSQTLTAYDVVILGEMPLTSAQASMFTNWVKGGGNLIAMRPDKQLAGLLGLTDKSATLSDAYLLVNTTSGPGVGIVNQTIQYHGTADVYTPNGASRVADLYSSLTAQAAGNPVAVSINNVGTKGGQAAAFTYDLAKSIVYTHQGNPAQVLQHLNPWQSQYIVTDLFYPNWTDFNRIAIPQADEQQRLLANMILQMNSSHKPLPRLWYFPRGSKAVVILTGDDHNNLNGGFYSGSTQAFFDYQIAHSPSGCSVSDWTCVRSSSYLFAGNPLTNEQAAKYTAMGFEIGIHSDSALGTPAWCADWSPTSLVSIFQSQLAAFTSQFWSLSGQASIRSHCYAWYGYVDEPKAELSHGIRLDTDIAYWPGDFVQVPAGFMGGSALPMRYADVNGAMVDVYASPTLVTDDDGPTAQPLPNTINTFLDGALGSQGYYGAFTVNIHSDYIYTWSSAGESQVIASAQSRGVPVISGQQMVDWLDGRNASTFQSITWNGSVLGFNLSVGAGAKGLQVMIPTVQPFGPVSQVTKNNVAVPFWTQTVKGISYVVFNGDSAHFNVTYTNSSAGPVISNVQTSVTSGNQAAVSFTTSVPASTRVDYGTSPTSLSSSLSDSLFTTSHTFNLTGLTPLTHYYYRVTAVDAGGHTSTYPAATSAPLTFLTPVLDTLEGDFLAGTLNSAYVSVTDNGEVIPAPVLGTEFSGTSLPTGWFTSSLGGTAAVANGSLTVNGMLAGASTFYTPGHSLEFTATFTGDPNQHIGFGNNFNPGPWAIFSTGSAGTGLLARSNTGTGVTDTVTTSIPGSYLGSPHRYRIDWLASSVVFYIDGAQVASHAVTFTSSMRPLIEDSNPNSLSLSVNWIRMSPYAASGSLLSRVLDAGQQVTWQNASWTADVPSGASLAISVRTGNTSVPDSTWSAFTPLASPGAAVNVTSRYIQYRADLTSPDGVAIPVLRDVSITLSTGP